MSTPVIMTLPFAYDISAIHNQPAPAEPLLHQPRRSAV